MTQSQNDTSDDAIGIRWESEEVSAVFGENNQSDKRVVNPSAQILVIVDLDKFRATFGDQFLLGMSDGTSTRVMCQRIGRKFNGHDIPANRAAVLNAVKGIRAKGATVTRRGLPDGTFYHGTDETEYRTKYAAALVDLGTDGSLALTISKTVAF